MRLKPTKMLAFSTLAVFVVSLSLCKITGAFEFTVLHTNDVHTRFEQTSETGGVCTAELAADARCFGGEARRATVLRDIRRTVQNVLLLDAGDRFQGTVWFFAFRGRASAFFMNRQEYDAMALGNHEFDLGITELASFLQNVTFPVLSCNINNSAEPSMNGLYACYTTVTLPSGDRVGIVGYTLPDTPLFAQTGKLTFNTEIDSLQSAVDNLIDSGIDTIIALGHSGIDRDIAIAKKVRGVDIVIGGHTNTFMYSGSPPSTEIPYSQYPLVVRPDHDPTATVLVVSAFAYGKYLGRLDVTVGNGGVISSFGGNPILLNASIEQDPETLKEVQSWRKKVDVIANQIVGTSLVLLRGNEFCFYKECNMGNVMADAMLEPQVNRTLGWWSDVAVALTTSGSVKASKVDPGDVTINDLILILPYGNTIDVLELRGKHILDMLEHSVRRYEAGVRAGEFLQVSGLLVVYDFSRPAGNRVLSVRVRCAHCDVPSYSPIVMDKVYKVVTNSFVAGGGYGFQTPKYKLSHVKGELDVDVTSRYFQTNSPIRTGVEDRVTIYNGDAPCYLDSSGGAGNNVNAHVTQVFVGLFFALALKWQLLLQ